MNHDTNEASKPTQAKPGKTREFERRLAILKTEIGIDFPNLIPQLEAGRQVVLLTDRDFASGLDPEVLRRFGGMMMLCAIYGATVVFFNEGKLYEVSSDTRTTT